MQILSLDLGSSKTSAVLANIEKDTISVQKTLSLGSCGLYTPEAIVPEMLAWLCSVIATELATQLKSKPEVILSLSPQFVKTYSKLISTAKRYDRAVSQELEEMKKDQERFFLEPVPNSPEKEHLLFYVPYIPATAYRLIINIFKSRGWQLKKIMYWPKAYRGVLPQQGNTALVNLGGNTTEILFRKDTNLEDRRSLPMGGEQVVRDLVKICQLPDLSARTFLFSYTQLFAQYLEQANIELGDQVIDARIKELFNLLKLELKHRSLAGVYLCGGLADLPKLQDYLQEYLQIKTYNLNEQVQASLNNIPRESILAYLLIEEYLRALPKKKWFR